MILQIATALAIGAYVVLSKDPQPKHLDAVPRRTGIYALAVPVSEIITPEPRYLSRGTLETHAFSPGKR
jgi:hypothetical protein